MDEQRAKARAAWAGSGEAATEAIWFDVRQKVGATEFLGYDTERAEGQILAIVRRRQARSPALQAGEDGWIVVSTRRRSMPRAGGQVGDTGQLVGASGEAGDRATCRSRPATCMPITARSSKGELKVGDDVAMTRRPDRAARQLRAHHSATHLLHEALRRHARRARHAEGLAGRARPAALRLQPHQARSRRRSCARSRTRSTQRIRKNSSVDTRLMTPEEAIAAGAMALFGEKYGEEVRVLSMGGEDGQKYSVELCGGTHALRTGDIGLFKIVGEGAVAAGVRRIEAVTGAAAEEHVRHQAQLLADAAAVLKVRPEDLPARLQALVDGQRKIERELSDARKALALAGGGGAAHRRPTRCAMSAA